MYKICYHCHSSTLLASDEVTVTSWLYSRPCQQFCSINVSNNESYY